MSPAIRVNRRNLFARFAAAGAAGTLAWRATAASAAEQSVPRVAYHLSELEKVTFVLGNIDNHIKGMGGADRVRIELVVHGPALAAFRTARAGPDVTQHLSSIASANVGLVACGNTMSAQKLELGDLLPGFVRADEGGVVRLHRLQIEGYAYLRP